MTNNRILFVLVFSFLLLNLITIAIIDPDPPTRNAVAIGYFIGSLYAQALLAAVWVALGPGSPRFRLAASAFWVLVLPIAPAISFGIHSGQEEVVVQLGACLVGQWFFVQLLLAPLAWRTRLNISQKIDSGNVEESEAADQASDNLDTSDAASYQFGISDLLVLMAISAVLLGLGRAVLPMISFDRDTAVFLFLAVAAIIVALPLLLSTLLSRLAYLGIALSILQMAVGTYFELSIMNDFVGISGPNMTHLVAINVTSTVIILLVTLALRFEVPHDW